MAFTTSENYNDNKTVSADALEWGQAIVCEEAPEYITLKPGEYEFTVKSFERSFYNGGTSKDGKKKEPCNVAKVKLEIVTDEGTAIVNDSFFLKANMAWKISSFFQCIGMAKTGESFVPDWDKAIGCTGRVKTKTREYNNNTYNDVDRYVKRG